MYGVAKEKNADVVKANFFEYSTEKKDDTYKSNLFLKKDVGEVIDLRERRHIFYQQPSIWSAIYKRQFLKKNKIRFLPSAGASYQDAGFNFKVFATARRVVFMNESFLHYRQDNPNSSVKSEGKVYAVKDEYDEVEREKGTQKERVGYVGPGHYYLPQWTVKQVEEVSEIMFDGFHKDRFEALCKDLAIFGTGAIDKKKRVTSFSDGTKMKLMLANVFARDTEALILDEPASPLDPLMRERLCEMIQNYIEEGNGERSVFFSTYNVSDMENITDYAIIMEHGKIVEEGFVDELKEKYILVKGDAEDKAKAKEILYTISANHYGFEGICLAENLDKLAGMDVTKEIPSLYQISVAVMKANSLMGR
jgi:ABC-2 type transport system ATP-binding protein